MPVGLIWNARDSDMIELVGKNRKGEWAYVWGIVHTDGIAEAAAGHLAGTDATYRELNECVIVLKDEWDQLLLDLENQNRALEALEDEIAYLRKDDVGLPR